jgi:carotenoid cleavage dioxygenase-like enzyme
MTTTLAAPTHREATAVDLPVTGRLPTELDGRYLRIGPSPMRRSDVRHSFVGEGMVHGVRLRNGRAEWYRSRWVRSSRVCRELAERPIPGPRHGLCDDANGNVIQHAGRILALGDAGVLPVQLDGQLDSVSTVDFEGTLSNGFAAHPECDPVTGELFAIAYYHEIPHPQYLIVDVDGRVRRSEPIPTDGTPMMHSLSLTDRHVVFFDLPVVFDPRLAAAGSRCPYSWRRNRPARLGVLRREARGADVRWFDVDPCFVFHPLNAHEDGDRITLDVIRHDRVFDRDPLHPGESTPTLWRWTIDLGRNVVRTEQLDDTPEEFPRIDDRLKTMPYRYAYTVAVRTDADGLFGGSRLRKHDLMRREVEEHDFGPGHEAGEAVFVPRCPYSAEDDGWLLTYVHDASTDLTDLVVLDAGDFSGPPVATVRLPVRVPPGLHANWLGAW